MYKPRRTIPHIQQSPSERNCGAVCLAMLLQSYGRPVEVPEITRQISAVMPNGLLSCRNSLMLQFAKRNKLTCCIVSVKDVRTTVETCMQNGIDVILSFHPGLFNPSGHFAIVIGCDSNGVTLNDPLVAGLYPELGYPYLSALMQPGSDRSEIVVPNTMVLLAPEEDGLSYLEAPSVIDGADSVRIFSCIADQVVGYIDPAPTDGLWLRFELSSSASP